MRSLTRGMMNGAVRTRTDGSVHGSVGHQTRTATPSSDEADDKFLDHSQNRSASLRPIKVYDSTRPCGLGGFYMQRVNQVTRPTCM